MVDGVCEPFRTRVRFPPPPQFENSSALQKSGRVFGFNNDVFEILVDYKDLN